MDLVFKKDESSNNNNNSTAADAAAPHQALSQAALAHVRKLIDSDHWHAYYLELDRAHNTTRTATGASSGAAAPESSASPLPVGANGDGDEDEDEGEDEDDEDLRPARGIKRERERPRPYEPDEEEERPTQRLRLTETEEERFQTVFQEAARGVMSAPEELLYQLLLDMFVPSPTDLPGFSQPRTKTGAFPEGGWYPRPHARPGQSAWVTEGGWGWEKVSHMAQVFTVMSNPKYSPNTAPILRDKFFARDLWRKWLDGPGAHPIEAGRCTRGAVPAQASIEQQRGRPITGTPHWYTHGFLPSVVLHRSLLNSARNVLAAKELTLALTDYISLVKHAQGISHLKLTNSSYMWINAWMNGEVSTPAEWDRVRSTDRWNMAWFATQLAHGFLTLDFAVPDFVPEEDADAVPNPRDDKFYNRPGTKFMKNIREDLSRVGEEDGPYPMVVRLPALLIGSVLGGGEQMIWGPAGEDETDPLAQTWIRIPVPVYDNADARPDPMAESPLILAAGLSITGLVAPGHEQAPRIGVAMPDEPRFDVLRRYPTPKVAQAPPPPSPEVVEEEENQEIASQEEEEVAGILATLTSVITGEDDDEDDEDDDEGPSSPTRRELMALDESLEEETGHLDDTGGYWYTHLVNVWAVDVRIDTPESFLALLARVGSRRTDTMYPYYAPSVRTYALRLRNKAPFHATLHPLTKQHYEKDPSDIRYRDGKNIILSRCWMPRALPIWLRGRQPNPAFHDSGRGLWTIDVGDATCRVEVLILNRCYGGPALPTVVPDLRMRYLFYGVPVYRLPGSGGEIEDTERIINHGRLDRILLTPRTNFVLDRVAFSKVFFDNADWWMCAVTIYDTDSEETFYEPQYGWLQGAFPNDVTEGPQPAAKRLYYRWKDVAKVAPEPTAREDYGGANAEVLRQVFGPSWDQETSRTNLETAFIILQTILSDLNTHERPTSVRLQWTNVLFAPPYGNYETSPESNPVQDMLTALDNASGGLSAFRVWLSLHPSLRANKYLGPRVRWNRVGFNTFDPRHSLQLSVRLGMTAMPQRRGTLAFMDFLTRLNVRTRARQLATMREPYMIIDFRSNSLDNDREFRDTVERLNILYNANIDGIRILVAENPVALTEHEMDDATSVVKFAPIATLVERLRQRIGPNNHYKNYKNPINLDQTIGYAHTLSLSGVPQQIQNPYGANRADV